jgi:glycerophosphoryl diester phosphodiesterase
MGISFKFPIDTYESIEPCLRIGADGTEMDVQLTKDSVLVVYHHQDLKDGTLCNGMINDQNWDDIKACNLASPFSSNVNLLRFNDLMSRLRDADYDIEKYTFTFDCKLYTNQNNDALFQRQYAKALLDVISRNKINAFIESSDTNFLRLLMNSRTDLKLFIYPPSFDEGLAIAKQMALYGMTLHNDHVTEEQIKEAHDSGFRVTLFGLSTDDDNLNAIYKSPDYVQSDRIIHLLKVFDKYKE